MKVIFLQHVHFETPGAIEDYLKKRRLQYKTVRFFETGWNLPSLDDFDVVVVMGGPMNIYEYDKFPWLKDEKEFLRGSIDKGKRILGICLGAQLLADVLGAKIFKNKFKEIGWFEVFLTGDGKRSKFFKDFPERFMAFHWHGDTFEIPTGAKRLAESEGAKNQAFEYDNRVVGLQFHLETTPELAGNLLQFSGDDLTGGGKFVNSPDEIKKSPYFSSLNKLLNRFLDNFLIGE